MTKIYTRLDLKIIAICSMFLDHGMKLFAYPIKAMLQSITHHTVVTEWLFLLLIGFGRLAFLLFGFQIAEGVRYTHDLQGYWKRLGLFALLSEIPYQMMVSLIQTGEIAIRFGFQNVFVILLLGAVACGLFQQMMRQGKVQMAKYLVFVCATIAMVLHTDYGGIGVLYIFLCYLAPYRKKSNIVWDTLDLWDMDTNTICGNDDDRTDATVSCNWFYCGISGKRFFGFGNHQTVSWRTGKTCQFISFLFLLSVTYFGVGWFANGINFMVYKIRQSFILNDILAIS